MAGDWLKFEKTTLDKPEVFEIAGILGIDPDAVIGKLLRVWNWFDDHTGNGNAPVTVRALLDRYTGVTGFSNAMESVGWLVELNGRLILPKFERHNGSPAKSRALGKNRAESHRARNADRNDKSNAHGVTEALPEKRREEKRRESAYAPALVEEASEILERYPIETGKRFSQIQSNINKLHHSWKKRPHFSRSELEELQQNAKTFFDLTEWDWKLLEAFIDHDIPESWGKFWRPDSRAMFVRSINDVLTHADRWEQECKRRGVA